MDAQHAPCRLTGDLWRLSADGKAPRLMRLPRGAADRHSLVDQHLLVIPLVLDDSVRAYRWTPGRDN